MPTIVPAILEQSRDQLDAKIFQITRIPGVERIQVDFGDGNFVERATLPVGEFEPLNPAFQWEAHLMVRQPGNFLDYQIAGFKTIVVHFESYDRPDLVQAAIEEINKLGMTPGIAIDPETPVKVLKQFQNVSHFIIMDIHPGAQGRPFLEATYERIRELRTLLPHAIIEVDGGINQNNAAKVTQAGADYLVVGSALFETENINENFEKIKQSANSLA